MKFEVGQKLYYEDFADSKNNRYMTITRVTKGWLELGNKLRVSKTTLGVIPEGSGRFFLTKEEYDKYVLDSEFQSLRYRLHTCIHPSAGVTLEDVREARKLLRI